MSFSIDKGQTKYLYSFTKAPELRSWCHASLAQSPAIAVWGRSNVGKSSVLNALFGKNTARISKTPGATKAANIFQAYLIQENSSKENASKENTSNIVQGIPFYLIDLPGYGYAKRSHSMAAQWNSLALILLESFPLNLLHLCLQDMRHPFMEKDKEFLYFSQQYLKQAFLVFNKKDKLNQKETAFFEKQLKEQKILSLFQQIYCISALTKENIPPLELGLIQWITKPRKIEMTKPIF